MRHAVSRIAFTSVCTCLTLVALAISNLWGESVQQAQGLASKATDVEIQAFLSWISAGEDLKIRLRQNIAARGGQRIYAMPTEKQCLAARKRLKLIQQIVKENSSADAQSILADERAKLQVSKVLDGCDSAILLSLVGVMAFNDVDHPGGDMSENGQIDIEVFELVVMRLQRFPASEEMPALQLLGDYTLIDGWFASHYYGRMKDLRLSPPSVPAKTTHAYY